MPAEYSLQNPSIFADPYPLYQRLRSAYPVHLDSSLGCWVVTSYTDVALGLSNRSLSSERARTPAMLREEGWDTLNPLFHHIGNLMFFADQPKHTQIRSLMNKALSARMVEKWRSRIQSTVDELLDGFQDQGHIDIMQTLALPLPMRVIADMLGIPSHDRDQFKLWSDDLAHFLGNPPTLADCIHLQRSMYAFMDYFRGVVEDTRTSQRDDLLNALIHAEDQGVVLTLDELLINCVGLFAGGHETTTNLIGNGLLALLHNQEQLRKLQETPSLIVSAVEELLRYDSAVQFTARVAKQTTEIGGKRIHKGQSVMLMLGAANRDPLKFDDPDRFDIERQNNHHLAFGHNIHYCIGAALARLEAQIAITTLLRRMPALRLAETSLEWQENLSFHGLKALHVTF